MRDAADTAGTALMALVSKPSLRRNTMPLLLAGMAPQAELADQAGCHDHVPVPGRALPRGRGCQPARDRARHDADRHRCQAPGQGEQDLLTLTASDAE